MKFVLNRKKGTTINHPAIGKIEGAVARQVTDEEAITVKGIINVIIFDEVQLKDGTRLKD